MKDILKIFKEHIVFAVFILAMSICGRSLAKDGINDFISSTNFFLIQTLKVDQDAQSIMRKKNCKTNLKKSVSDVLSKEERFLVEHVGCRFGIDISTIQNDETVRKESELDDATLRHIKLLKRYKIFDRACLEFPKGKLTHIELVAHLDKKKSYEEVVKISESYCKEFELMFGHRPVTCVSRTGQYNSISVMFNERIE